MQVNREREKKRRHSWHFIEKSLESRQDVNENREPLWCTKRQKATKGQRCAYNAFYPGTFSAVNSRFNEQQKMKMRVL